ncbi:MAG: putative lyase, partial [uncultured Thermomicrobiales bacterium]
GHHHSRELPPARRPGRLPGVLPGHPRLRGPQRRRIRRHAVDHGRTSRPARHVHRLASAGRRPRRHRRRAPHHRRDDGQGNLRHHHPRHRERRRHIRAAAGQRRRGRPGTDRPTVRSSRLRHPRSRGQPDPHQRAAL